jgi:hypothetical protein
MSIYTQSQTRVTPNIDPLFSFNLMTSISH